MAVIDGRSATRRHGPCGHKVHLTSAIKAHAGMKALSSLRLVCLRCAGKDIETTLVYSGRSLRGFCRGTAEMPVDDIIRALRTKVDAATDELDIAVAVHEAWKVAARDRALHARIGTSRVAVPFYIIQDALRRDVILALMRLWDKDRRAVGMKSIANSLCDTRVVDALAADCESHWDIRHHGPLEEMSEEGRAALQNHESAFAREQSTALRARVVEVIDIVASYSRGGSHCSTFAKLEEHRNERLAHRQVISARRAQATGADPSYREVDSFHQDMVKLIRLLRSVVLNSDYDPEQGARNPPSQRRALLGRYMRREADREHGQQTDKIAACGKSVGEPLRAFPRNPCTTTVLDLSRVLVPPVGLEPATYGLTQDEFNSAPRWAALRRAQESF